MTPAATTEAVQHSFDAITDRIRACGVDPSTVAICGVTKTFGADVVRAAAPVTTLLGENYASELLDKARECEDLDISWQFLGPVQRNKVAKLAPFVHRWQSVARVSEGESIARVAPGARVLVQVDATGRPDRNGVAISEVASFVEQLRALALNVEGLMTVAPMEKGLAQRSFEQVRAMCDALELSVCSMGMTDDLELAVGAGSTMVRIGRALFGSRQSH